MKISKRRDVCNLISLIKKNSPEEMKFLLENMDSRTLKILIESLFNLTKNPDFLVKIKNNKLLRQVQKRMGVNKKSWLSLIDSKSGKMQRNFLKKQCGTGVFTMIASLLLPLLLGK